MPPPAPGLRGAVGVAAGMVRTKPGPYKPGYAQEEEEEGKPTLRSCLQRHGTVSPGCAMLNGFVSLPGAAPRAQAASVRLSLLPACRLRPPQEFRRVTEPPLPFASVSLANPENLLLWNVTFTVRLGAWGFRRRSGARGLGPYIAS
jgi:hypothetical protein